MPGLPVDRWGRGGHAPRSTLPVGVGGVLARGCRKGCIQVHPFPRAAGAVTNKHFTSPDFNGKSGKAYGNYTTIFWTSSHTATLANKSPWLKLP